MTPFRDTLDQLIEAASDPVITHCYFYGKCHEGKCRDYLIKKWIKLANMTGYIDEIEKRYPKPFERFRYISKGFI